MVVIRDVDHSYANEEFGEVSEGEDSSVDDDDELLTDEQEREDEEFSDDEEFTFSEKVETDAEELSDDGGVSQEEEEEVKINFLQIENLNTWYSKNYKLAVEVVGAQGIDSGAKPGTSHLYYVIVFTRVGVVRNTELSVGDNSSVWWRINRPLIFPVDGLDLLRRRTEKDKNTVNENYYYYDDDEEEEEEFVYFQIVRANSFNDNVGTSHGNMVVGQARANVPLSLIPVHFDLDVIEPFRLGGRCKGLLRVKMTLLMNMIPSREGQVIGWNVGGDPAVAERRRTTAAKGININ